MKKSIVFMLVAILMLTVACKDEQPTKVNTITYDKHTIQEDTNWVEVTDIDTLNLCFGPSYWGMKNMTDHNIIIKSENEYKTLFDEAVATTGKDFHLTGCDTVYKSTEVDYNNRFLIIYGISTGDDEFTRQIFKSKTSNEYLHLVSITRLSSNELLRGYFENISLLKIDSEIKVIFDTLRTNF